MSDDRQTILVVDDAPQNIDVLSGILRADYKVKVALNGEKALAIAHAERPPDLILLDLMMPQMDGYEVCRRLKLEPMTRRIPVIFVTAMNELEDEAKGFTVGCVDYLTKPVSPAIVLARVRTHLALYDQQRELDRQVRERTEELNVTRLSVIRCLGKAAEYKDDETGLHVVRMSYYAHLLGLALGMSEADAEMLLHAAPMHDVGKIGIPDRILQKPGKLDPGEWEIMKTHALIGAEILGEQPSELLRMAHVIAVTHHEKWDGSGYPHGLKGKDIPLVGRIVAICDVFDALTSPRPYKPAWPVEDALAAIRSGAGSHFDPQLVEKFLTLVPALEKVRVRYSDPVQPRLLPAVGS